MRQFAFTRLLVWFVFLTALLLCVKERRVKESTLKLHRRWRCWPFKKHCGESKVQLWWLNPEFIYKVRNSYYLSPVWHMRRVTFPVQPKLLAADWNKTLLQLLELYTKVKGMNYLEALLQISFWISNYQSQLYFMNIRNKLGDSTSRPTSWQVWKTTILYCDQMSA